MNFVSELTLRPNANVDALEARPFHHPRQDLAGHLVIHPTREPELERWS